MWSMKRNNVSAQLVVAAFLAVLVLPCTESFAPPSECKLWLTRFIKNYVLPVVVPDPRGQTISAVDMTDPLHPIPVEVKVGKRLGFGMKGAVYDLDAVANHPFVQSGIEYVAKISHVGRRTGLLKKLFLKVLTEEEAVFRSLVSSLPQLEAHADYPKDAAWEKGSFPIVPIVAVGKTNQFSHVLVKTKLKGMFVKDIAKLVTDAKLANGDRGPISVADLPADMAASLREWYQLSQAATQTVKITPEGKPERFITCLDINPDNLVWVTDPQQMALYRLKRPSFVAVELGEPALTNYVRADLLNGKEMRNNAKNEEEFLKVWADFLNGAK